MSENDSGTAAEAKLAKFAVGQLVLVKDQVSKYYCHKGWVRGYADDGWLYVELKIDPEHLVSFRDDQLEATELNPPNLGKPVTLKPQPAPLSALRVVINQDGVKRVIEGPFQINMDRHTLCTLYEHMQRAVDSGYCGWMNIFDEPKYTIDNNEKPLPWS